MIGKGSVVLAIFVFASSNSTLAAQRMIHLNDDESTSEELRDCSGQRDFSRLSPATAARARHFYVNVTLAHLSEERRLQKESQEALKRYEVGSFTGSPQEASAFFARQREARARFGAERGESAKRREAEYRRRIDAFVASVPASERRDALRAVLMTICTPTAPSK